MCAYCSNLSVVHPKSKISTIPKQDSKTDSSKNCNMYIQLTFAYVLILEPQLALHLLIGVPDGAGLLEAVHRLLHKMIPKLLQNGHEVTAQCGTIQRMNG